MTDTPFRTPLRGIVPPLVTPLREPDVLDDDGLVRVIDHVLAGGVAGIFILGTTGEGPSLSYRLRYELVERTCEVVAGRAPVLVGITDPCLAESIALADFARASGAAAVVAAPPYYFPVDQAELAGYFERLAGEAALPLLLYNIPICTKVSIGLDVVRACARLPRVVGVKDSGGDLGLFRDILAVRRERPDWTVLIGPEHLTAEAVRLGGDGGVNGGSLLHPRLFVSLYEASRQKDEDRVRALQADVLRLGAVYQHGSPVGAVVRGIKGGLALLGLCRDLPAPPLRPLTPAERQAVADCLAGLGLAVTAPALHGEPAT